MTKRTILSLLAVVLTVSIARADTISGALTVDNTFTAYLSTSPTATGTQIATGNHWGTVYSFSGISLTAGTTYYLQIAAVNTGGPGGVLGNFNLSGTSFQFSNGAQSLLTNTANWTYSKTGFGLASLTPVSYGANGVAPWHTIVGIPANSQWIWDTNPNYLPNLYFETTITPADTPVPEPGSIFLLGAGILALGGMAARTRRTA
jgi:hypothetical protein